MRCACFFLVCDQQDRDVFDVVIAGEGMMSSEAGDVLLCLNVQIWSVIVFHCHGIRFFT